MTDPNPYDSLTGADALREALVRRMMQHLSNELALALPGDTRRQYGLLKHTEGYLNEAANDLLVSLSYTADFYTPNR